MSTHDGRLKIAFSIMEDSYHQDVDEDFKVVVNALRRWLVKNR